MTMRNYFQEYFAELVFYGGLLATRNEVYHHTLACAISRGADKSTAYRIADRSAAQVKPFDGDAEEYRRNGWTHKAFLKLEKVA